MCFSILCFVTCVWCCVFVVCLVSCVWCCVFVVCLVSCVLCWPWGLMLRPVAFLVIKPLSPSPGFTNESNHLPKSLCFSDAAQEPLEWVTDVNNGNIALWSLGLNVGWWVQSWTDTRTYEMCYIQRPKNMQNWHKRFRQIRLETDVSVNPGEMVGCRYCPLRVWLVFGMLLVRDILHTTLRVYCR